jgi:hypothetical protein
MRWNIAQKTDVTLHSELDVTEDISVDLENLSRLARLGNFAAAKYHFTKDLSDHQDNLYVHIQYAQMLFESGNYKSLNSFKPISDSMISRHGSLGRNYKSIMHAAKLRSDRLTSNTIANQERDAFYEGYLGTANLHLQRYS